MKFSLKVDLSAERRAIHKALGWITFQVRWYLGLASLYLSRKLNSLSIWLLVRPQAQALANNVREAFGIDSPREMKDLGRLFLNKDAALMAWIKSDNRHGWVLKEDDNV